MSPELPSESPRRLSRRAMSHSSGEMEARRYDDHDVMTMHQSVNSPQWGTMTPDRHRGSRGGSTEPEPPRERKSFLQKSLSLSPLAVPMAIYKNVKKAEEDRLRGSADHQPHGISKVILKLARMTPEGAVAAASAKQSKLFDSDDDSTGGSMRADSRAASTRPGTADHSRNHSRSGSLFGGSREASRSASRASHHGPDIHGVPHEPIVPPQGDPAQHHHPYETPDGAVIPVVSHPTHTYE